jgi:hypothetical protein
MPIRQETSEDWARNCCSLIERYGSMALSPQSPSSEDHYPKKSPKKKRKVVSPITDAQELEDIARQEKEFEITGTRNIIPEDRGHLEAKVKMLRPAFEILRQHIKSSDDSSVDRDTLFQNLRELMLASYYVGAYTAVSLGVQKFVTPAVLREKAKTPQQAKAETDMQKRRRLRAAIENATSGRQMKGSIAFAILIRDRVLQHLGPSTGTWPSAKTIATEIQAMNREKRNENKATHD